MEKFEKFDILKYRKCIYLIESIIHSNDSSFKKSQVNYFFRITFKVGAKLYKNGSESHYAQDLKYYKKTNPEQRKFLLDEIKRKFPDFDLREQNDLDKSINEDVSQIELLTEENCIEFLKGKGYLIYKQI
jgi:hypothetical protein